MEKTNLRVGIGQTYGQDGISSSGGSRFDGRKNAEQFPVS
jgi:hypothetical protein